MNDELRFLDAWIRGVKLAGPALFGDGGDPELARTKWDLRPNLEMVDNAIGNMSGGEAVFLAAMYCFFSDTDGAPMLQRAYGVRRPVAIGTIAARIDDERRGIIADLFMSYRGW